jgi:hypothetical protein
LVFSEPLRLDELLLEELPFELEPLRLLLLPAELPPLELEPLRLPEERDELPVDLLEEDARLRPDEELPRPDEEPLPDPLEPAELRPRRPLLPDDCSSSCDFSPSSSPPLPISFFATAAAAGTATPNAAPATTFFVVDVPSFASFSTSPITHRPFLDQAFSRSPR